MLLNLINYVILDYFLIHALSYPRLVKTHSIALVIFDLIDTLKCPMVDYIPLTSIEPMYYSWFYKRVIQS